MIYLQEEPRSLWDGFRTYQISSSRALAKQSSEFVLHHLVGKRFAISLGSCFANGTSTPADFRLQNGRYLNTQSTI